MSQDSIADGPCIPELGSILWQCAAGQLPMLDVGVARALVRCSLRPSLKIVCTEECLNLHWDDHQKDKQAPFHQLAAFRLGCFTFAEYFCLFLKVWVFQFLQGYSFPYAKHVGSGITSSNGMNKWQQVKVSVPRLLTVHGICHILPSLLPSFRYD